LSAASADKLLALVGKTPSLMQETLLLQALKAAPSTPAIVAAVGAFPSADQQKLLTAFDTFRGESGRVGFTDVKGEAAAAALTCLAFAKDQVAVDNISKGLETWSKMEAGYGSDFSAVEARGALKMLEPYINKASTTNLVFGAFAQEAPKAVAREQNAAVVAKPDEKWGETPCAFVMLKSGAAASAEDIIAHCRANLAGYKCPRGILFVDALPLSAAGKVQKAVLRQAFRTPDWR
jgi:hypothetical protein